jgi:predicted nucleotidyltransferase
VPQVRDRRAGSVRLGRPGDAGPDSDVDLLYVRVPGNDLGMAYFDLQDDLERLFGHSVDLVAKEGLHRVIRDQVLADAQVLYAA